MSHEVLQGKKNTFSILVFFRWFNGAIVIWTLDPGSRCYKQKAKRSILILFCKVLVDILVNHIWKNIRIYSLTQIVISKLLKYVKIYSILFL